MSLLFDMGRASANKKLRPFVMEHELGRAVIIGSALVAILSSSTPVSKDNVGTEECICRDNLFFCAPEAVTTATRRDVLEREQFSSRTVAISVDEAHCVSNGEFDNDIYASAPLPASLIATLSFCHYSYVIINYNIQWNLSKRTLRERDTVLNTSPQRTKPNPQIYPSLSI